MIGFHTGGKREGHCIGDHPSTVQLRSWLESITASEHPTRSNPAQIASRASVWSVSKAISSVDNSAKYFSSDGVLPDRTISDRAHSFRTRVVSISKKS
jgi:hypothetical protein